jgi:hypothetical protein
MRLLLYPIVLVLLFAIACGKPATPPTAPTPTPPNPTPSSPTLTRLGIRPEYIPAFVGDPQQFRATAVFSDASERDVTANTRFESSDNTVMEISPGGLLKPIQPGTVEIRGTFQETQSEYSMRVVWRSGTAPGEVYGQMREAGGDPPFLRGEVEIVGGGDNGLVLQTGGDFLFRGLKSDAFDLIARSTGYQPTPYRVTKVPSIAIIELRPDPSLVSEVLDASVCPQSPASRTFKTSSGGIFRITGARFGYYEGGPGIQVFRGGSLVRPSNFDGGVYGVYEFPPGAELELRISLGFDCATFHVNYLRPRF